jgi:selenocysteine lyase/cysteine desulfurase
MEPVMLTRRAAIGSILYPAGAAMFGASLAPGRIASAVAAANAVAHPEDPAELVAQNEDYWRPIQQAFTVDRSIINLNNGGVSPSPAIVQDAMKRHLDFCNTMPPPIALWEILEPRKETVRRRIALHWNVDPEEIAITRNASESLMICQHGFDLQHGDEVLTTTQDYPRMLSAFRQRERRHGIVLKTISIPVPCEDPALIVSLFERNISPRTKLILISHMINITGQILPVKEIVAMARVRSIPVIVDGAHALAHFDFKLSDLECDYYGVSLHKWLFAPHGTGLLYVRRDKIKGLWPLFAAHEKGDADIRKFEEIGTHPAANSLAIGEALTFHQGIGDGRKEARLRYLRDLWATRLLGFSDRVKLHTSLKPEFSCGIATFQIDGIDPEPLVDHLKNRCQILTTLIKHDEFQGVRVTPSVYTTIEELERFCEAIENVIRNGIPAEMAP